MNTLSAHKATVGSGTIGCGGLLKAFLLSSALVTSVALFAFDTELLLLADSERPTIREALLRDGRTNDLELLEAAWSEDGDRFIAAAKGALDVRWDRGLAELLLRQYTLLGREADRASLEAEWRAKEAGRRRTLAAATPSRPLDCSGRVPVVFLHGYGGDATTWTDFVREFRSAGYGADDLLVFQYAESSDDSSGAAAGLTALGGNSDTPIQTIAGQVAKKVRVWLRRRAGFADDDATHDAELPAADFICHSMGGLVFRRLCADHPDLVRRCVDLGTPHFGQNISSSLTGFQTQQMNYGSSFLWSLAEDWFFRGRGCRDMIFIVGAGTSNRLVDHDVVWDSLVCAFSATLLTQADGEEFARRTFFVNRVHSSVLTPLYENAGLPVLDGGQNDPVFRLAYGYLNDSHYFANGQVPTWEQVMSDDGASDTRISKVLTKVLGHGGLFIQALHPTTNSVSSLATAIKYDPGTFYPDAIVTYLQDTETSTRYEWSDSDYYWEHGHKSEGCTNGLVLIYGNIPAGTYKAKVKEPAKIRVPYSYPYYFNVSVAGGGVRVLRTRPANAEPQTEIKLSDDTGKTFSRIVPNSWFAENGLVTSAEDLAGCLAVGSAVQANGLPAAASQWLGLDPSDVGSTLAFDGLEMRDGEIRFRVRAGERSLRPEDASATSPSRREPARFVIQSKVGWGDPWQDVPGLHWTSGDGIWRLPPAVGGFFRIVVRP